MPTLEHIPPKASGGKPLCLTCQSCNSKTGSQIESHLSHYEKGHTGIEIIGGDDTTLLRGRAAIKTNHSINPPGLNAEVIPPYRGNWDVITKGTEIRLYTHDMQRVARSIVKSAYLVAGCATSGATWKETWAPAIREYILNGGPIPPFVRAIQDKNIDVPPHIGKAKARRGLPNGGWIILNGHIAIIMGPTVDLDYQCPNPTTGAPSWSADVHSMKSGFPEYGAGGYW